jgi:hypothetical protein
MKFWGKSSSSAISDQPDDDESLPPPPPPPLPASEGDLSAKNNSFGHTLSDHGDDFVEEASIEHPLGAGPKREKCCTGTRLFILIALLLLAAAVYLAVLTVQELGQEPGSSSEVGVDSSVSSVNNLNSTAAANATAPPCVDKVSVNKNCYEYGDNITVTFKVCNPTSFDWVGLYRLPESDDEESEGAENIFSDRLRYREWTCGLPEDEPGCDETTNPPPSDGTIDVGAFVRPGSFQIYLASGEEASLTVPYLAVSEAFSSSEVCSD